MTMTNGGDQTAQLTVLGTGRLPQPEGGPSVSLLEVFPNRFPHRPYVVSMAFPEYTSLCPVTGQPDFGTIVVEFIPDQKCVESKSFKLYMFAYRNHQSFMESITNTILEDFVEALDPMWCRVKGLFCRAARRTCMSSPSITRNLTTRPRPRKSGRPLPTGSAKRPPIHGTSSHARAAHRHRQYVPEDRRSGHRGLVASYTLPTDTQQSGDGLGLQLAYLLGHAGFGTPGTGPGNVALDGCVISSVVPGMNPLVAHACERFLELTPRFAHRDLPIPLENRYERPNEVGADRLVGAFGARRLLPDVRSVVSVDYGTATNFDCVTGNAYLGGLICPGVMSSLGALATRTAQLPRIALTAHADVPIVGRSTVTSLNHGFLFGFASMTEGLYARLTKTLEGPVAFVATGGFAPDVARVVDCFDLVRPDLVLEGLRLLWLESRD